MLKRLLIMFLLVASCVPAYAQKITAGGVGLTAGRKGASFVEVLPTYPADPRDYGVDKFWLTTAYTDTMLLEGGSSFGTTPASADADTIGRLESPCGPHHVSATTGATDRPTLASDATRLSSLRFTRASSQKLDVYNSTGSFRFLHDAPFTISLHFKRASTGTRQYLIDTSNDTLGSGNYGLRCFINTDNTMWIDIYGGHATNYLKQWNVPSFSFTDTAGWHHLLITLNAIPGTLTCQYDDLTAQTSSVAATNQVATNRDAKSDLRIGGDMLGSGHYWDGLISDLVLEDSVLSAGSIASMKAYNPARSSASLNRYSALTITNPATQMSPPPYVWADFADATGMYQTDDTSSAVTASSQTLGRIESKGGSPNGRHLSRATAGRRPIYTTNVVNGRSAIVFDGDSGTGGASDDLTFVAWTKGKQSYYIVANSTTPGAESGTGHMGSHLLSQGAGSLLYAFWTSPLYQNPNRLGQHLGGPITLAMDLGAQATQEPHQLTVVRSGATCSLWIDGVLIQTRSDLTSAAGFAPNHMGEQAFTTTEGGAGGWWDLKGSFEECLFFNTDHSDTERRKNEDYLKTKWGTP